MIKNVLVIAFVAALSVASGGAAIASPASAPAAGEARMGGWEKLGERTVNGKADTDVIAVGRDDGLFRAIQIKVEGSSLVMREVKVVFENGETFEPKTRLVFGKDTKSRVIDLPGTRRAIKRVQFKYGNLPGGGNARVELWGLDR